MPIVDPFSTGSPATPTAPKKITDPWAQLNPGDEGGGTPTPWGFLGNVWDEAGDMVEGVTHLLGAGAHDVAQAVKVALPGEQYGESEGFKLDDIAMALPAALSSDYKARYGISKFAEGDIWGGLSDLFTGLYERPLSAIGDALIVGKAATLPAKAGMLGKGAGSVGGKILGYAPENAVNVLRRAPAEVRGSMQGVSLTAAGDAAGVAKPLGLALSENPVARLAQTQLYKLGQYRQILGHGGAANFQRYIDNLDPGVQGGDLGKYNTAMAGMELAKAMDLPVWRPGLTKAIEGRGISKAMSLMGIQTKDEWIPYARQINAIQEQLKNTVDDVEWNKGALNAELMGVVHGTDGILDAPSNLSPTHWNPDPALEASVGTQRVPVSDYNPVIDTTFMSKYGRKYGETGGYIRIEATNQSVPLRVPWDMTGQNKSRYLFLVDDMNDAANVARQLERDMGGKIRYVDNTIPDPSSSYSGYHIGVESPDGTITDISIATPDLAGQQTMWGKLANHAEATSKRYDSALQAMQNVDSPGAVEAAVTRALMEAEELDATRAWQANVFDYTNRVINSGGDAERYSPVLQAADRIRPITFNAASAKELASGHLTARVAMDRAYGPIRVEKWSAMMNGLEADVAKLLDDAVSQEFLPEDLIAQVADMIAQRVGAGHPVIEGVFRTGKDWNIPFTTSDNLSGVLRTGEKTIAGDNSWLPNGWRERPGAAAQRIVDEIREATHKQIVENAESPGFTWKELLEENADLPAPQYYPHIKASKLTSANDVWVTNRKTRVIDSVTPREKKWGGWLYETGRFEMDPVRAYTSLFREVAKHQEFAGMMTTLVQKYGRKVSEDELSARMGSAPSGEVLISKAGLTHFVSEKTKLMTLTHEGMMSGKSLADSTVEAMQVLFERARRDFEAAGRMVDEVYSIPTHVAKHIDRAAKLTLGQKFNFYYDSAMNMWKASVLSLSPRWVVNNTIGNLAYMGVAVPRAMKYAVAQLLPSRRALMRSVLGDEFSRMLERDFVHGTFGSYDERLLLRAQDAGVPWAVRAARNPRVQKSRTLKLGRGVSGGIRTLNAWIEDAARRGVALESLRRQSMLGWESRFMGSKRLLEEISRRGIPDKAVWSRTVDDVNRVLGDYLVMSPLEQQIVRRYMMPFYAFYRHTAKFVARMPFESPIKVKVLEQVAEIDRQMEGVMPDYMRGAAQIFPGQFLNLGRGNPMQAVTEAYWPSLTHPLLGLAVQRATGTNPFGSPYTPGPEDGIITTGSGIQYAIQRGPNGEYLGAKPLDGQWQPPMYQSIGSLVPQFALLPGVDVFGRDFARKAAGLVGIPYSGFNLEGYRAWKMRQDQEAYGRGYGAVARGA